MTRPLFVFAILFLIAASDAFAAAKPRFLPEPTIPKTQSAPAERRNGFSPPMPVETSVNSILSEAQFAQISSHGDGVIKSEVIKFLIDHRAAQAKIYFINGNFGAPRTPDFVQYHFAFAEHELHVPFDLDQFNQMTYFSTDASKKLFTAGTFQKYTVNQNGQTKTFYGIQFYPQDVIKEGLILGAAQIVKAAVKIPNAQINFVSYGQQQTVSSVGPQLKALGVGVTSLNEIYAAVPYIAMNKGEAWGYLRNNPTDPTPDDIIILKELPLDLSVVAGVITMVIQDAGSHVNLKSKERGTIDMVLRDPARLQKLIQAWENRPVHITVSGADFTVEASSDAEIASKHKSTNLKPWFNFQISNSHELKTFDEMASVPTPRDTLPAGLAYGGKASKLGFLAHAQVVGEKSALARQYGKRLTPLGFGIPISFYFDFVAANPALKLKIQALADSEMSANGKKPLTAQEKQKAIADIQALFHSAQVPAPLMTALAAKVDQMQKDVARVYPQSKLKKIKMRSSSNSEDVPDFDGAGLHDSFSSMIKDGMGAPADTCKVVADPEVATKSDMEPNTVACAIKGVYASLWNRRAVEERSYAHINHARAGMAIAVNQTYGFREKTENITEVANAVIVTRILAGSGIYGYQLSLNSADNLVTNPTPGTQSEIVLATFLGDEKPSYTVTQFAQPKAGDPVRTTSIVPQAIYDKIVTMARQVETSYCKAVPGYYNGDCSVAPSDPEKPKSLDMEFKIFSNGEVLIKQSREFSGH